MKHQLTTAAIALAFVLGALATGSHRRGALLGAGISGVTALGSILAMSRFARGGRRPVQAALAVMTVTFLLRIFLVALGVYLVVSAGESVVAFVVAFFASYFAFVAVEGAFVHTLSRGTGPTA